MSITILWTITFTISILIGLVVFIKWKNKIKEKLDTKIKKTTAVNISGNGNIIIQGTEANELRITTDKEKVMNVEIEDSSISKVTIDRK